MSFVDKRIDSMNKEEQKMAFSLFGKLKGQLKSGKILTMEEKEKIFNKDLEFKNLSKEQKKKFNPFLEMDRTTIEKNYKILKERISV